jgi:hypothetical protein
MIILNGVNVTQAAYETAHRLDDDTILYNGVNGLRKWRKAKADQDAYLSGHISNPGIYNINFLGDSITEGYSGSTQGIAVYEKGLAKVTRDAIKAIYGDTGTGFMPNCYPRGAAAAHAAWTYTGTWQNYGTYSWWNDPSAIKLSNSVAGNTVTANFDDDGHFVGTGIVLMVYEDSAGGDFTVSIDGGAAQTFTNYHASSSGIKHISVTTADGSTPLTEGSHTCVITTQAHYFSFVGGYSIKAATSGFRVNTIAASGATINGATAQTKNLTGHVTTWSPKLTIASYISNDQNTQTALAYYLSSWQTLITSAKTYGDVLVTSIGGIFNNSVTIPMQSYRDALFNLAMVNDCAFLDVSKAFGTAFATANAAGYLADSCHYSVAGHQAAANCILKALDVA